MRRREMALGLCALPALASATVAAPAALRKRFDRFLDRHIAAWKSPDGPAAVSALYSPDVHWVNVVGMHWQGKADVDYAHRALFNGPFKGISETLEEVESLVPLPGGGAIAVLRWAVGAHTSPGGHAIPPGKTRMTMVLVPHRNEFLIAHAANIPIIAGAQASDPVRKRDAR